MAEEMLRKNNKKRNYSFEEELLGSSSEIKPSYFTREGVRLKHEGDALGDPQTAHNQIGKTLQRALLYCEASLYYIKNGCVKERRKFEEESEKLISAVSSCIMYKETIKFLDFIQKLCRLNQHNDVAFEKLFLLCLQSQALLHLRFYKLNKEKVFKCREKMPNTFKTTKNEAIANNLCLTLDEAGMTWTFADVAMNLMQAHEKWHQAEALLLNHKDYFHDIDNLSKTKLTLDSSLQSLITRGRVVLHKLREECDRPTKKRKKSL